MKIYYRITKMESKSSRSKANPLTLVNSRGAAARARLPGEESNRMQRPSSATGKKPSASAAVKKAASSTVKKAASSTVKKSASASSGKKSASASSGKKAASASSGKKKPAAGKKLSTWMVSNSNSNSNLTNVDKKYDMIIGEIRKFADFIDYFVKGNTITKKTDFSLIRGLIERLSRLQTHVDDIEGMGMTTNDKVMIGNRYQALKGRVMNIAQQYISQKGLTKSNKTSLQTSTVNDKIMAEVNEIIKTSAPTGTGNENENEMSFPVKNLMKLLGEVKGRITSLDTEVTKINPRTPEGLIRNLKKTMEFIGKDLLSYQKRYDELVKEQPKSHMDVIKDKLTTVQKEFKDTVREAAKKGVGYVPPAKKPAPVVRGMRFMGNRNQPIRLNAVRAPAVNPSQAVEFVRQDQGQGQGQGQGEGKSETSPKTVAERLAREEAEALEDEERDQSGRSNNNANMSNQSGEYKRRFGIRSNNNSERSRERSSSSLPTNANLEGLYYYNDPNRPITKEDVASGRRRRR